MHIKEKINQFTANVAGFLNNKVGGIDAGSKKMIALQLIPVVNIIVRAVKEKQLANDLTSKNSEVKSLAEKNLKQLRTVAYIGTGIHLTAALVGTITLAILFPPSLAFTAPLFAAGVGAYGGAEWAIRNRSKIEENGEKTRLKGIKDTEDAKLRTEKRKEKIAEAHGFWNKTKAYFA